MPKVSVKSTSQLSAQESYDRVKNMLTSGADLKSLDPSFSTEFDDGGLKGKAKGGMFSADFNVEHSGTYSTVTINIDLPMKLALMKGMIQKKLQGHLDDCLS